MLFVYGERSTLRVIESPVNNLSCVVLILKGFYHE